MTAYLQCDYCGRPIDGADLYVKVNVDGQRPDESSRYPHLVREFVGHFHTDPQSDDDYSCEGKVLSAIQLAMSFGPTLETIETKTGQWVAQQRRKHTKPGEAG